MDRPTGWRGLLKRYGFELVVVFLGVWLSLVAESFRQDRILAHAEKESLQRLVLDLSDDLDDMGGNLVRAEHGIDGAGWVLDHRGAGWASPDSLGSKLAQMGPCSNLGENRSEYVSLQSSGALNIIRDPDLRQEIVKLYESRTLLDWWHELDCRESEAVLELMSPYVRFGVPGVDTGLPQDVAWHLRRHPLVEEVLDREGLFHDQILMNRIAKLLSGRRALQRLIVDELEKTRRIQREVRGAVDG